MSSFNACIIVTFRVRVSVRVKVRVSVMLPPSDYLLDHPVNNTSLCLIRKLTLTRDNGIMWTCGSADVQMLQWVKCESLNDLETQ